MDDLEICLLENLLENAFPPVDIDCENLICNDVVYRDRVICELTVAKISGHNWKSIDIHQARGTWDVLLFLAPNSMAVLLPGYLKWLLFPDEADILPDSLIRVLRLLLDLCKEKDVQGALASFQLIAVAIFVFHVATASLGATEDDRFWEYYELVQDYLVLAVEVRKQETSAET